MVRASGTSRERSGEERVRVPLASFAESRRSDFFPNFFSDLAGSLFAG